MSSQTPRRSARTRGNATPSVAGTEFSAQTTARTAPAATRRTRATKASAALPIVSAQSSSAYGSKGNVSLSHNQPGHASNQFSTIFEQQRQTALAHDDIADETPSRPGTAVPVTYTESVASPDANTTEQHNSISMTNVSKSFGRIHEGGVLNQIRFEPPQNPRPAMMPPPRRVQHAPELTIPGEDALAPVRPTWTSIIMRFFNRIPGWFKLICLLLCLLSPVGFFATNGGMNLGFGHSLSEETANKLIIAANDVSAMSSSFEAIKTIAKEWSPLTSAVSSVDTRLDSLVPAVGSLVPRFDKMEEGFRNFRERLDATTEKLSKQVESNRMGLDELAERVSDEVRNREKTLDALKKLVVDQARGVRPSTDEAQRRINWFAPGHGAAIIPRLTSPTQVKPQTLMAKAYLAITWHHPAPKAPITALEPWEEPGDCWCAAASKQGKAQLGVQLGYKVFPTDLIVEYFPKSGVVDQKSAPKTIETWVLVTDPEKRAQIDIARFNNGNEECSPFPHKEYVCIGKFEYATGVPDHVQSFGMEVRLNDYSINVSVQRVVVRVTENWGADWTCLYRVKLEGIPAP